MNAEADLRIQLSFVNVDIKEIYSVCLLTKLFFFGNKLFLIKDKLFILTCNEFLIVILNE